MATQGVATGESLRALRKLARLSLADVASKASTSTAYLSKVERGLFVPTPGYVARVTQVIAAELADAA